MTSRLLAPAISLLTLTIATQAEVKITPLEDRVRVEIDGKLFTEYRQAGAPHVFYHPIIGPDEVKMTRSFPMEEVEGEERDHPHHRSLWFSHGDVNGVDFWSESKKAGKIVHDKVIEAKGGADSGVLTTSQNWVAPDGSIPMTSVQTITIGKQPEDARVFDFTITLKAGDKDVVLGDTKEGTCGIRIAESMRVRQPKGKKGEGHIVNSEGDKDGAVWGKKAAWVDMFGPINGKTYGIAFLDHPKNFTYPTRWHARDYGLFAVNPFCGHEMDKSLPKGAANHTIKAGESLTLRYRLFLHKGEPDVEKIKQQQTDFASR